MKKHASEAVSACAVLVVKDDDFGFNDEVLGVGEIEFAGSELFTKPRVTHQFSIELEAADSLGNIKNEKDLKVSTAHS